jgi:hypothetical protein
MGNSQEVAIQSNPEPKGLDFLKAELATAPRKREGGAIQVVSSKTREQICDELCCEIDKAAGVPLAVADRMASQMANALVWPKPEDQTEAMIKAITALAEYAPQNAIEAA